MVNTFELISDKLRVLGDAPTMNSASARLPQGAYTTFRTYSGNRVLRLPQHLRRLEESLALLNQAALLDDAAVRRGLDEALQQTGYAESRFRLTFSPPNFYISLEPFTAYPALLYVEGVRCVTVSEHRDNPHAKSTAFIASAGDAYRELPVGVHEGLMVGADCTVLEGLSSNFFAVLDGVLHTEQERALLGVTQSLALEVARDLQPAVQISPHGIAFDSLPRVSEAFITSVSREIMPVVQIDDHRIGAGVPGAITRKLMDALQALIAREAQPLD